MNAGFWNRGMVDEKEVIFKVYEMFSELDDEAEQGRELDEHKAHRFLELLDNTMTVVAMRKKVPHHTDTTDTHIITCHHVSSHVITYHQTSTHNHHNHHHHHNHNHHTFPFFSPTPTPNSPHVCVIVV